MPTIHNINFTIYIDNDGNAAFGESVSEVLEEIRRITEVAVGSIEESQDYYENDSLFYFTKPLRDSNGNKVGKLSVDIEFEPGDEEDVEEEEEYE